MSCYQAISQVIIMAQFGFLETCFLVMNHESFSVTTTASGKPGADCDSNFHEYTNRDDKRSMHGATLTQKKKKKVSLGQFLQEGANFQISNYSAKCTAKEDVHNLVKY